jgi:hypothetical protein
MTGRPCRSGALRYVGTFSLTTKRIVLGHVRVCQSCCCGNTANGKPAVPVEWLKKEWRAKGLLKRIQLSTNGSLGPCDVPKVVTISNENAPGWLGGITEGHQCRTLLECAISSKDAGRLLPLPDEFRRHTFHPFHNPASGGSSLPFSRDRVISKLSCESVTTGARGASTGSPRSLCA